MDGASRYPMPFVTPVLQEITEGWKMQAIFVWSPTAQSSRIRLNLMPDPKVNNYRDVVLHMDVNFMMKSVTFNNIESNVWGHPELGNGFPFHPAMPLNIDIVNTNGKFIITYGTHSQSCTHAFRHRLRPSYISHIVVDGDFLLDHVSINNSKIQHNWATQKLWSPANFPASMPVNELAQPISRPIGFVTPQVPSPGLGVSPYQGTQPYLSNSHIGVPSHPEIHQPYTIPHGNVNTPYPTAQVPYSSSHQGHPQTQIGSQKSMFSLEQLKSSKMNKKQLKKALKYGAPIAAGALVGGLMLKKGKKIVKGKWKHGSGSSSSSSSSSSD